MAQDLTPPYKWIHDELYAGRVIPFLGAGASFGSRNPSKTPWRASKGGDQWDVTYLPTASELAECFAVEAAFPPGESRELTKVAQYFGAIIGRAPLQRRLGEIFAFTQAPGPLHEFLARAAANAPLLIVTTNYDDLIERAFTAAKLPYDSVIHATASAGSGEVIWCPAGGTPQELLAKDLDIDLTKVTVIYKMHGTIDRSQQPRPHYVITEDDYIDFLTRMTRNSAIPKIFALPFQERPFLFLGYGLCDWNLRVVLNRIDKEMRRPGEIESWAIETLVKPLEKKLWSKRGVTVFDGLTLDEFVDKLENPPAAGAAKP